MVFSSIIFLLYFFPVVFILYFLLNNKIKNAFLLTVSILFYMWGAPKFIFAIREIWKILHRASHCRIRVLKSLCGFELD